MPNQSQETDQAERLPRVGDHKENVASAVMPNPLPALGWLVFDSVGCARVLWGIPAKRKFIEETLAGQGDKAVDVC